MTIWPVTLIPHLKVFKHCIIGKKAAREKFLILFFLLNIILNSCFPILAQPPDSTRILTCRNFFNLTSTLTKPIFSTTIANQDDNLKLKYRTVNPLRFGIALDYRWFGVEVSSQIPTTKFQDIRKGKTQSSSLRFTINNRKIAALAHYQNYKGFYLNDNKFIYNPFTTDNPLPKRPDMINTMIHINAFYYFNHQHYSNPAAAGQYEIQIRSGGSPLMGAGYLFNSISADSSLIPRKHRTEFPNMSAIAKVNSSHIYGSVGYCYSFIFRKKFFINLAASPGIARFQVVEARFNGTTSGKWDLGIRLDTRGSIGYNGKTFYYGTYYSGFWTNERLISGNYLLHTFQTFRFFVGWRFRTHKNLGFLGL